MEAYKRPPAEETLDPDDWEAMRALGHQMVDDLLAKLKSLPQEAVWQHAPQGVKKQFETPPPLEPQDAQAVYEEYLQVIQPYLVGTSHPRFWGWIAGSGTIMGAYAELLASALNSVSGGFSFMSANYVEMQVLDWCKALLGFPATAGGQLTGGLFVSQPDRPGHGAQHARRV